MIAMDTRMLTSCRDFLADKSLGDTASDVISDSSGVGTSQSDTTNSLSNPGTTVVCVEGYSSGIPGHLTINQGDILEGTIFTIFDESARYLLYALSMSSFIDSTNS